MPLIRTLREDAMLKNATVVWHGGMRRPGSGTKGELLEDRPADYRDVYSGRATTGGGVMVASDRTPMSQRRFQ